MGSVGALHAGTSGF
jgi:uncharacterized protein YjbJ (UPF0337 family)